MTTSASWSLTLPTSTSTDTNTIGSGTVNAGVDLALDADGDLDVSTDARFTRGLEAATQGVRLRVQAFKGDWFLDLDDGIDYWGKILGQKYQELVINTEYRNAILDAPGVTELQFLTSEFNETLRLLQVNWTALTGLEGEEITDKITLEV